MPVAIVTLRLASNNTPDLPLEHPLDWTLELGGVPRRGDEIAAKPLHFVVTRVMFRPGMNPLIIVSPRDVPEARGRAYPPPSHDD